MYYACEAEIITQTEWMGKLKLRRVKNGIVPKVPERGFKSLLD